MAVLTLDLCDWKMAFQGDLDCFYPVNDTVTYTSPLGYKRMDLVVADGGMIIVALGMPEVTLQVHPTDWTYYVAALVGSQEVTLFSDSRRFVVFEEERYRLRATHMGTRFSSADREEMPCSASYYTLCDGDDLVCVDPVCRHRMLIAERHNDGTYRYIAATPIDQSELVFEELLMAENNM